MNKSVIKIFILILQSMFTLKRPVISANINLTIICMRKGHFQPYIFQAAMVMCCDHDI